MRCLASCGGALIGINSHFIFSERQREFRIRLLTAFQQPAAQQWKFLHRDSVAPRDRKISPYAARQPGFPRGDAFEGEHAVPGVLSEPCEYELYTQTAAPFFFARGARFPRSVRSRRRSTNFFPALSSAESARNPGSLESINSRRNNWSDARDTKSSISFSLSFTLISVI